MSLLWTAGYAQPMMKNALFCSLLCCALVHFPSGAAPLVNNPSFEDGLNGWSRSRGVGVEMVPHTGVLAAINIGPTDFSDNFISQFIAGLTVGEIYDVSFWARNSIDGFAEDDGVQARFAGQVFRAFQIGEVYQQFRFSAVATATSEELILSAKNPNFTVFFDDVEVTARAQPVPELDSALGGPALLTCLLGLFMLGSRRRAAAAGAE